MIEKQRPFSDKYTEGIIVLNYVGIVDGEHRWTPRFYSTFTLKEVQDERPNSWLLMLKSKITVSEKMRLFRDCFGELAQEGVAPSEDYRLIAPKNVKMESYFGGEQIKLL